MFSRKRAAAITLAALGAGALLVGSPPTSTAATPSAARIGVVAQGLEMPFGIAKAVDRPGFVVAENAGRVTRVLPGGLHRVLLRGAPGVAGVATSTHHVFAVIGGPNEDGSPSGGRFGPSRVIRMDWTGHHVTVIANLLRYELKHNPDHQVQFVHGKPVDSLSNPFSMTYSAKYGLLVADGGANDVLRVNPRTGHVSTFFAPPTVTDVPACQGKHANANPGTRGCDPVPTGVQVVGDTVYVCTLGAEAPGAGRVYKLDARTGKILRIWKNLTAPTGIAVRHDGTIFVSQVLYGAPEAAPPPGFDPAKVGRITRIRDGVRTHAQVTMPTGLVLVNGRLVSTAWSVASFLGIMNAGQVVRVGPGSFQ